MHPTPGRLRVGSPQDPSGPQPHTHSLGRSKRVVLTCPDGAPGRKEDIRAR